MAHQSKILPQVNWVGVIAPVRVCVCSGREISREGVCAFSGCDPVRVCMCGGREGAMQAGARCCISGTHMY